MKHQARIGADPEFFVASTLDGNMVPAYGLIGGEKGNPIQLEKWSPGYSYHEDGAAVEFNIPPQTEARGFVEAINKMYRYLSSLLGKKGLMPVIYDTLNLPNKYLADPRALVMGCDPDYDAYGDPTNNKRNPFTANDLGARRFAGAHIHVEYNTEAMPAFVAARYLDLWLSLPMLRIDRQGPRRQYYGLPGLHRPKPYGVEYRTLSNCWVFQGGTIMGNMASNALSFAKSTWSKDSLAVYQEAYTEIPWEEVQLAIKNEDTFAARHLLDHVRRQYGFAIQDVNP